MDEKEERTLSTVEEIEQRRADRREGIAKARAAQYAKDIVEIDRLEQEHGDDRVVVLEMKSFVAGLPTVVVVSSPGEPQMNRFRTQVRKAKGNQEAIGAAQDMLAATCVAYPADEETYSRMKKEWTAIHDNVGVEAVRLGEAKGKP